MSTLSKPYSMRFSEEQMSFLNELSQEMSVRLGEAVPVAVLLRAIINREMDEHRAYKKVWDETT